MFDSYLSESVIKRGVKSKKIAFKFYNPRDFAVDKHCKTDDKPYGGGPGMVMKAEPILKAVKKARGKKKKVKIIILSPGGKAFDNKYADTISKRYSDIVLICGRYEGIDARVKRALRAEEVNIGPYILTGGELAAMVVADVVARRVKGVLGNDLSLEENRVSSHEMYTRPGEFTFSGKKYKVPPVLRSGHHKQIENWREEC